MFFEKSGGCLGDSLTVSLCKKLFAKFLKILLFTRTSIFIPITIKIGKMGFISSNFKTLFVKKFVT